MSRFAAKSIDPSAATMLAPSTRRSPATLRVLPMVSVPLPSLSESAMSAKFVTVNPDPTTLMLPVDSIHAVFAVSDTVPATVALKAIRPGVALATRFPLATTSIALMFSRNMLADTDPMLPLLAVKNTLAPCTSNESPMNTRSSLSVMLLPTTVTFPEVLLSKLNATTPDAL